jgi:ABC-type lipoprotein release transport system permease subunit
LQYARRDQPAVRDSPTDVFTLIAVAGLLAFIGLIASIVPVIRATKVDPQMVLRSE